MEQGDQRDLSEVIVLRASGAKPRLYCFPGLLVSTREYVKLVDYLGADQLSDRLHLPLALREKGSRRSGRRDHRELCRLYQDT